MQFDDVIHAFGEKTGMGSLAVDADGSVGLLFDGEHEITFTPDKEDHSVLFHAEVASASFLDRDACLKLLKASLLGSQTGGAAFSVQEALGKVVLWKRHDDGFEDCSDFERAVNAFLSQVIFWKDSLKNPGTAGEGTESNRNVGFHGLSV